jgi:peroxiredoxin
VALRSLCVICDACIDSGFDAGSWGCTKEVCQLQTLSEKENFKRANTRIIGVSVDSVEKQKAFVEKMKLTVRCLVRT